VPQVLVISDANVLIDMEAGGLLRPMFRLDYHFAVPDVLYEVELRQDHTNLLKLGLRRMELSGDSVRYVETLAADIRARGVSRNDLFALALARQEDCLLLTGDSRMRKLAKAEGRTVHGTLWLIAELIRSGHIKAARARGAYDAMRAADRWLPWDDVERQIKSFKG